MAHDCCFSSPKLCDDVQKVVRTAIHEWADLFPEWIQRQQRLSVVANAISHLGPEHEVDVPAEIYEQIADFRRWRQTQKPRLQPGPKSQHARSIELYSRNSGYQLCSRCSLPPRFVMKTTARSGRVHRRYYCTAHARIASKTFGIPLPGAA